MACLVGGFRRCFPWLIRIRLLLSLLACVLSGRSALASSWFRCPILILVSWFLARVVLLFPSTTSVPFTLPGIVVLVLAWSMGLMSLSLRRLLIRSSPLGFSAAAFKGVLVVLVHPVVRLIGVRLDAYAAPVLPLPALCAPAGSRRIVRLYIRRCLLPGSAAAVRSYWLRQLALRGAAAAAVAARAMAQYRGSMDGFYGFLRFPVLVSDFYVPGRLHRLLPPWGVRLYVRHKVLSSVRVRLVRFPSRRAVRGCC